MTQSLRIFTADDAPDDFSLSAEAPCKVTEPAFRLLGTAGLYRRTTLMLWSCGILLIFVLPVFAASLDPVRFRGQKETLAFLRSSDGPTMATPATASDQKKLLPVPASLAAALRSVRDDDGEHPSESLRLLVPLDALNPASRDYATRTIPLAQILARRIVGSRLQVRLCVAKAEQLDDALKFAGLLPQYASISSDRIAVAVNAEEPDNFLTIELTAPVLSANPEDSQ